ncbi:MAG: GNAT family N-acetyltransferase [Planctomycetota bacterium]|nr:GNAT family N-acetyltransferase [Planctomycetota bacterium]
MTRPVLRLRPFDLSDATTVVPWLDSPGIGLPPGSARERWAERLLVDPRVQAWMAVRPSSGAMLARMTSPDADPGDELVEVGFVRLDTGPDRVAELTLAVAPLWRRTGIGNEILSLVLRRCQATRVRRLQAVVDPNNRPGIGFFRESGFEDSGQCGGAVRFVLWIHETDPHAIEIEG